MNKEELQILKKSVDKIDDSIIELLHQRKDLTGKILKLKAELDITLKDSDRENEIVDRLLKKYNDEDKKVIKQIYHYIFADSIKWHKIKFNRDKVTDVKEALKIRPLIIAGPCSVESRDQIFEIAEKLSSHGLKFLRGGAFKPRTSPDSFQGLQDEGIKYLNEAAKEFSMFTVSEILNLDELDRNFDSIDVVQIGSRNMASYGFLKQVGKRTAETQKPIILKRGFSSTITEFLLAAKYLTDEGNENVILCLRGIRTFEQIDSKLRFTSDLASILELKSLTNLPVIFDPSHSTGLAEYVVPTAKSSLILGGDGLLIETHTNPSCAMSDKDQCILPEQLFDLLCDL